MDFNNNASVEDSDCLLEDSSAKDDGVIESLWRKDDDEEERTESCLATSESLTSTLTIKLFV